ncbi:hypothetical protein M408DRAFT_330209 [Serendipita vermifera MAFF 305830]|uniref:Uncharacterized protein n=1 Tax=Serendipita vermifera MAFF 305830 TaxID=933852 RepID=A0A0C3B4E2_SERVB|nr:hypothetical protein M408DRAFT_330209 [Serendipita vermifera MAFF 305830]
MADMSYIYLSLAAPSVILGLHLLYLFNPFFDFEGASYTIVSTSHGPSATDTPTDRTKLTIETTSSTKSEERNPLVSSTLTILSLVLLTVLVGAVALSSGTVAFLNSVGKASIERAESRLELYATTFNTTVFDLERCVDVANGTFTPEFESVAANMDRSMLSQLLGDITLVARHHQTSDQTSVPPPMVLAMQALLSFIQTILLGKIVGLSMQSRASRYGGECEDEEMEMEWASVADSYDSTEEEEFGIPAHILEYLKNSESHIVSVVTRTP